MEHQHLLSLWVCSDSISSLTYLSIPLAALRCHESPAHTDVLGAGQCDENIKHPGRGNKHRAEIVIFKVIQLGTKVL